MMPHSMPWSLHVHLLFLLCKAVGDQLRAGASESHGIESMEHESESASSKAVAMDASNVNHGQVGVNCHSCFIQTLGPK